MQWDGSPNAGFTTGRPWLRLAPDATTRNVAAQTGDPDSVLAAYRRLLEFRRTSAALQHGTMGRLDSGDPDVLAWTRGSGDDELLVLVSFVGEERTIDVAAVALGAWVARVGTHGELPAVDEGGRLRLRGDEGLILARPGA